MKRPIVTLGLAIALVGLLGRPSASADDALFDLKDGDRVVLIGGTLIEREQESGHLETRLTRRYPDRSITFRNLGWSGDTVEGISQAGFGSVEDGFKHLVEHVLALKPTVVILGYGANESFEGAAGLPKFLQGLDKLLKAIEPTKARVVLLSPTRQEDLGPPLPDPARHNADLALYGDALKAEAAKRGAAFVDLFGLLPDGAKSATRRPLTDNGIHLTPYGYWRLADAVDAARAVTITFESPDGIDPVSFTVSTHFETIPKKAEKTQLGTRFGLHDAILPDPSPPGGRADPSEGDREVSISGMKPGRYALKVDGKAVASADADAWKAGVSITRGPEFDQVEALRRAIVAKNQLYFYRWRPQNETYLFGFRKHEQGQNAREIPQFDPLVAAKEAEIARLRVPTPHTYELIRESEVGR